MLQDNKNQDVTDSYPWREGSQPPPPPCCHLPRKQLRPQYLLLRCFSPCKSSSTGLRSTSCGGAGGHSHSSISMSARSPCPVSRRMERNTGKARFPRVSRSMTSCRACSPRLPALCRGGKLRTTCFHPKPRRTARPAPPTGTQIGETWGSTLSTSMRAEERRDLADAVTETPSSYPNLSPDPPSTTKPCCLHWDMQLQLTVGPGGRRRREHPQLIPRGQTGTPLPVTSAQDEIRHSQVLSPVTERGNKSPLSLSPGWNGEPRRNPYAWHRLGHRRRDKMGVGLTSHTCKVHGGEAQWPPPRPVTGMTRHGGQPPRACLWGEGTQGPPSGL